MFGRKRKPSDFGDEIEAHVQRGVRQKSIRMAATTSSMPATPLAIARASFIVGRQPDSTVYTYKRSPNLAIGDAQLRLMIVCWQEESFHADVPIQSAVMVTRVTAS